jgi:hypothetical protein
MHSPPCFRHTVMASNGPKPSGTALMKFGMPMDSSQSLRPNGQRHKDDVVPIVTKEGSTAEEAQFGGPTRNPDGLISTTEPPIGVDVTAELTAPPQDAAPQPAPVAPQAALAPVAAATSSEAIRQLETLARVASRQRTRFIRSGIRKVEEESNFSALGAVDQCVSSRSAHEREAVDWQANIPHSGSSVSIAALIAVGATFCLAVSCLDHKVIQRRRRCRRASGLHACRSKGLRQ